MGAKGGLRESSGIWDLTKHDQVQSSHCSNAKGTCEKWEPSKLVQIQHSDGSLETHELMDPNVFDQLHGYFGSKTYGTCGTWDPAKHDLIQNSDGSKAKNEGT